LGFNAHAKIVKKKLLLKAFVGNNKLTVAGRSFDPSI
jgi:hypothetical protein